MEIDVNEIKANIASGNYEELKQMKISDRVSNTVIVDLMVAENKEAIIGLYKTKVEPLYSKINEKLLPYFERGKIENLTFENSGREPIFNSLMEDPITGNNVKNEFIKRAMQATEQNKIKLDSFSYAIDYSELRKSPLLSYESIIGYIKDCENVKIHRHGIKHDDKENLSSSFIIDFLVKRVGLSGNGLIEFTQKYLNNRDDIIHSLASNRSGVKGTQSIVIDSVPEVIIPLGGYTFEKVKKLESLIKDIKEVKDNDVRDFVLNALNEQLSEVGHKLSLESVMQSTSIKYETIYPSMSEWGFSENRKFNENDLKYALGHIQKVEIKKPELSDNLDEQTMLKLREIFVKPVKEFSIEDINLLNSYENNSYKWLLVFKREMLDSNLIDKDPLKFDYGEYSKHKKDNSLDTYYENYGKESIEQTQDLKSVSSVEYTNSKPSLKFNLNDNVVSLFEKDNGVKIEVKGSDVDLKLDIIFTKDGYTLENIVGREGNIDIEKLADRVQEVLGRDDILISRETVE